MQKILIIGFGGAGKSTLARQLSQLLNINLVHLDALYWQPGWVETPKAEWRAIVQTVLEQDSWVIDGNFSGTLDRRLQVADTVIFLDFSRWLCIWRVIKRRWMYAGRTRPDMGADCPEKIDWEFLHWVWSYRDRHRSAILEKLRQVETEKHVLILRSPAEVKHFIQQLS